MPNTDSHITLHHGILGKKPEDIKFYSTKRKTDKEPLFAILKLHVKNSMKLSIALTVQ
jgi:hypothetical protein